MWVLWNSRRFDIVYKSSVTGDVVRCHYETPLRKDYVTGIVYQNVQYVSRRRLWIF